MSFSREEKQFYTPRQVNIKNSFEVLCIEENLKHGIIFLKRLQYRNKQEKVILSA